MKFWPGLAAAVLAAISFQNAILAQTVESKSERQLRELVAQAIVPYQMHYGIPGLAVGISVAGHTHFYTFGVASRKTRQRVSTSTLFEIGSVTKTFTATLASYAQVTGALAWSDSASATLEALRGTRFDDVSLLQLATHTAGGLPLQVPDSVTDDAQLMAYFARWQPEYRPGTQRTYSNMGIGMLGMITAERLHRPFDDAMEGQLFPALGLSHTYLHIPDSEMQNAAQGYDSAGTPHRLSPGVLDSEAYGIRSSVSDMLRFVEANMHEGVVEETWWRAIEATHTGYFKVGPMTQDVIWEQYPFPAPLEALLSGNSDQMLFENNAVEPLDPPLPPGGPILINKTGSTNGFSCYVAFVPQRRLGIVILANRSTPIAPRVTAAYRIMIGLAH